MEKQSQDTPTQYIQLSRESCSEQLSIYYVGNSNCSLVSDE